MSKKQHRQIADNDQAAAGTAAHRHYTPPTPQIQAVLRAWLSQAQRLGHCQLARYLAARLGGAQ